MEIWEVKKLLEKFYEGKTSLNEEEKLITFFQDEKVPEEMDADRRYFESMGLEKAISREYSSQSSEILQQIAVPGRERPVTKSLLVRVYPWLGAAAGLLLILSTYFFLKSRGPADTYDDPQLAYMEARKALYFVSSRLNEGTSSLSLLQEAEKKTSELNKINAMNRALNQVKKVSVTTGQMTRLSPVGQLKDPKGIVSEYLKK